jgi:hypothetical protein
LLCIPTVEGLCPRAIEGKLLKRPIRNDIEGKDKHVVHVTAEWMMVEFAGGKV